MKKIAVITGVTSFLGKSTARYLLSKGFIVFGILRPDSKNKYKLDDLAGLHIVEMNFDGKDISFELEKYDDKNILLDDEIKAAFKNIRSKENDITFIHFGWGATLDRNNFMAQMLNVDYSMKVLEFAKLLNANRFIFAGSQAEKSESSYGMAKKKFADLAVKKLKDVDMSFIHLRIFSIYGKEDRDNSLIKTLALSCVENKDIDLSSCEFKWNYLYIDDFVKMIHLFITKNVKTGTYDIASDDTRLLKDFCEATKEALKAHIKLCYGARPDSPEKFAIPDISSTVEAIGAFKFTKFEDGIKNLVR